MCASFQKNFFSTGKVLQKFYRKYVSLISLVHFIKHPRHRGMHIAIDS